MWPYTSHDTSSELQKPETQPTGQSASATPAKSMEDLRRERTKAELLAETMTQGVERSPLRRVVHAGVIIGIVVLVVYVGIKMLVAPLLVSSWTGLVSLPSENNEAHKRVVRVVFDYYPVIAQKNEKLAFADLAQGGTFLINVSADVMPGTGSEGYFRTVINPAAAGTDDPDIDIGYQLIATSTGTSTAFLSFHQLPSSMQAALPLNIVGAQWFEYPVKGMQWLTSGRQQKELLSFIWVHGLKTGAISARVTSFFEKNADGERVSRLDFSVAPEHMRDMVNSLQSDPHYRTYQDLLEAEYESTNALDILSAVRSLSGSVQIRLRDRSLVATDITFDIHDAKIGTMRGMYTSSYAALPKPIQLHKPIKSLPLQDVLSLLLLTDTTQAQASTRSETEASSPLDSDGDGYTDEEEIRAGYNPYGPGKL